MNGMFRFRLTTPKKTLLIVFVIGLIFVAFYHTKSPAKGQPVKLKLVFNQSLPEEELFPLAYGISIYKDGHQFLRLLQMIYRPFNLYCIHVDMKSDASLRTLVMDLTRKYTNVIVPEKFIEVHHSMFSVLESELLCMEALYKHVGIKWKYFINLTGQELPLKTNLEIVRILKQLRGANLMEKIALNPRRVPKKLGPPPHGIRLWKGAVHIITVRDFVRFALYDQRALDLLEYLRGTKVPDETYFSTLNHEHKLRAPGGYNGNLTRDPVLLPFLNRHKIWYNEGVCHGKFLRAICIFSMADVPEMTSNENMKFFANKFVVGLNDAVSDTMHAWFQNRTRVVYSHPTINPYTNLTYYSQLAVVQHHF